MTTRPLAPSNPSTIGGGLAAGVALPLLDFEAWRVRERFPPVVLRDVRELVVEVRRSLDPQVKVLQIDPLVWRVGVLVRLTETHEKAWLAGNIGDGADERDRSP